MSTRDPEPATTDTSLDATVDPIRRAAALITGDQTDDTLERRLKQDAFRSIGRIKPARVDGVDFERDVMSGRFFEGLPAPLQGIAIARTEGALAFYNRVGWHPAFLGAALELCVPTEGIEPLAVRYHARDLHDLAYVHPRHFEKLLGRAETATLWEALKRFPMAARSTHH